MKEQLQRYMQEQGLTQGQIAKAIGKSITTVSQYLKGSYNGRTDEIDDAVARLLQRENDNVVSRSFNGEFVSTYAAERCLDAIYIAHTSNDIAVITGAAGLGKTQALKRYVALNPETIFIEVNPSCNPKVLLKKICQKLGLNDSGVNDHAKMNQADAVRSSKSDPLRLLINSLLFKQGITWYALYGNYLKNSPSLS